MQITISDKTQIDRAAILWRQLESEIKDVGLTVTWDWVETWLETYGDLVEYHFVVGTIHEKPVGIALITKETNRPLPLPIKAYHVGTNGEPMKDVMQMIQNTILVKANEREGFIEAVIETILRNFSVEEIIFDDFSIEDGQAVLSVIQKKKYTFSAKKESTYYLDLDSIRNNGTTILSSLSPSMRKAIKRSLKVFNDVSVEWADNENQALDILTELIELYEAKWQTLGREGVFTSSYYTAFQKNIIKKLLPKKSVALMRVTSKKYGTLGCSYMLIDKGVAYYVQLGSKDFFPIDSEIINPNKQRVGYVVDALCMEECLNRGLKGYNFSVGVYPYKKKLTNAKIEVINISIRRSIKPYIRDRIVKLYKILDANKHSPFYISILRSFFK